MRESRIWYHAASRPWFSPVHSFDDERYGGSLLLVGQEQVDSLKAGDVILAEGDVQLDGNTKPATATYRVSRVAVLKFKED